MRETVARMVAVAVLNLVGTPVGSFLSPHRYPGQIEAERADRGRGGPSLLASAPRIEAARCLDPPVLRQHRLCPPRAPVRADGGGRGDRDVARDAQPPRSPGRAEAPKPSSRCWAADASALRARWWLRKAGPAGMSMMVTY